MGLINRLKSFFLSDNLIAETDSISTLQTEVVKYNKTPIVSSCLENQENRYSQLEDQYYQYFIGVNSLMDLNLNPFEVKVLESLENTIKRDHFQGKDIPRLPIIVPKLIHLFKTDDFNWKDVADLIVTEPVIFIGVTKIAKSSLYNLKVKDEKLEHILAQLGLSDVREVVLNVALRPIVQFKGGHFYKHSSNKIWTHAVKSAVACRVLAEIYKEDPFDAYLAGFLNNMGMVVSVKKMNDIKEFTNAPNSFQFKEKFLNLTKHISVKIADNWELNSNIILALKEQSYCDGTKIKSPLGKLLYEGTAVSMKHILMAENRWIEQEQPDNEAEETSFDKAYKELELLTLNKQM